MDAQTTSYATRVNPAGVDAGLDGSADKAKLRVESKGGSMKSPKPRRSLRSISLTWRFYDRDFLTWIVCVSVPIIVFNFVLIDFGRMFFGNNPEAWENAVPGGPSLPTALAWLCVIESLLLIGGIAVLGILTTHRLTGPYLNIKRTCLALANGKTDARLHFRKGDRLEDIADAFNQMADKFTAGKNAGQG